MMDLGIALSASAARWQQRHDAGLVPDAAPYGLDRLEQWGIRPRFDDRDSPRTPAERVLDRLTGWEWAAARGAARRSVDGYLAWDERHGFPLALRAGGKLPVYTGLIWASDERLDPAQRLAAAKALRHAAGVFVLSHAQIPVIVDAFGLAAERIHFVRFGIDAAFFRPQPGTGDPRNEVVFSAGSDRHRDFDLLVRAVARLRDRRPGLGLRIATGRLPEGPLPARTGECLGVIDHPSMRAELSLASVVVVPTTPNLHGSGMTTVLEAMACERPVIAVAGTGLEDYVRDGVTGTLVPPGDERALAHAIDRTLSDPAWASELGRRARESVLSDFTSALMAKRLATMIAPAEGVDHREASALA
jgi:glycosyltransferase involved in cell wall biosynthesis